MRQSGPPERYSVYKPKACSHGGTHFPSPFHYPAARLPARAPAPKHVAFIVPGLPALCCAARLHRSSNPPAHITYVHNLVHYRSSLLWRFKFARPWSILPDVSLVRISAIWYCSPVVHLSTAPMDPRRAHQRTNPFIDDVAEDDASLVSDGEEPDPDSTEGQAMALDRQDFNMAEEIAEHARRVQQREDERRNPSRRLDAQEWQRLCGDDLYHDGDEEDVPVAGPSSMRPRSPSRSMPPPPPLFLPDSRDPTPYEPMDPRDMTPFAPAVYQPGATRPPSSVPPPPLFLGESRDSTPFQPRDPRDITPFLPPVHQPGAPFVARQPTQFKRKRHQTPEDEEEVSETVIRVPDVDSSDEDETEGEDDGEEPEREEDSALKAIKLEQNMRQFFDDTALLDSDEDEDDDEHWDDALEETAEDRAFIDDTDHHELSPRLVRASSDAHAEVAAMQQEAAKYDDKAVAYQLELAQEEQEDRTSDLTWLDRDFTNITHPDWSQREVPHNKKFYSKDKKLYPTEEFEMYRNNAAALTHPHFTKIPQDEYLANRNRTRPSYHPPYPVMLDETPHKLIPQVPAQPFQGRPHLPLSHLEPGDWTLVPKHGLAFAISATEILVPNKTAQRPPPSHLDGSNDPPAPSKKQKRQKKPEKVEIAPVPRRKRDETEKPPLSKKLTAEQEQARKEKERYWEYHQVESEPLTREQLVAESQQTSTLVLTASKPRLLRPVVPSIDDLMPFQPLRPLLQFLLPRRGEVHGTALAPGDFVVVINDKRENSFGTILLIRDTPQYGRVVKVSGSRRLTLDYQLGRSREQLEDLSPASLFKVKGSKKAIWKVRRHPLDPTPPLRIGDRLCVVDDKHLEGAVGRIEKIDLEELRYRGEMITVRTTNGTVARLRTDSFHRIFYAGDEVEIVRGPQRGQCGIVMEVLFGGSLLRLLVDATPTEAATQESVTAFFAEGVPLEGSEQRYQHCSMRAKDVIFRWTDAASYGNWTSPGIAKQRPQAPQDDDPLPPNASKSEMIFHQIDRDLAASQIIRELLKQRQEQQSLIFASKGVEMTQLEHEKRLQEIDNEIRVHVGLAEDRKREADSNRMMGVGRRFENVTVFIYKGPNKGLTGKIIGDHDTEARRDREKDLRKRKNTMELDDTAGIIVTVRVPNVGDLQVPIEKCTRGRNRVPLASTVTLTPRELATKAMFLSYRGPLPPRPSTPPPPPSASGESEELWAPGPSRPPRLAPKWPETLPAESDGTWLASSKLLHKRLDVHIFGVLGAPGAISARVKTCEQGIGFVLLDKKPAGRSPQRENVKVYAVNGTLPPTAIPLFAVRPVRFGPDSRVGTTAQKALTMADSAASLCDIKERVVIIGPNIDGKNADFGEYAETIPEEKLDGENLVRVRLWPSQRRETYHISSLCCSRNIPTQTPDSPEVPAIVFD
ncbi:hypothetical protein C8R43DRAFT_1129494 [Mycena crocata]|nr:hypothetical protein C8R43DRAFT_1129494 [Mycena crocata]